MGALKLHFYSNGQLISAYSYDTCIFVRSSVNGRCYINRTQYSNTTRKHQSKVRAAISELDDRLACDTFNAPRGIRSHELIDLCMGSKANTVFADELLLDYVLPNVQPESSES